VVAAHCGGPVCYSAGWCFIFPFPIEDFFLFLTPPNWGSFLPQIPPLHPDFSLETLGFSLNELWGTGNFDWDAGMP
jgi:hypothetical protein